MDARVALDKIEIQELIARYCRACDSKDWALLRTVFTEDAVLDYSSVNGAVGSREEVCEWLEKGLSTVPWTMHYVTNIEIDLDGDRAKVHVMFYNPMLLPGMDDMSYCGGYYHHEVVRTVEGWKSARLVEQNVWFKNHPSEYTPI